MTLRSLLGGLSVAGVLLPAWSCALEGFDRVEDAPPGGSDAGADADAAVGCPLATYPPPPADVTPGGTEDFVVALRSIDLGESVPGSIGLDLDGKCTCQGDPPGPPSCKEPKPHCDGPEGRDNMGAALMKSLAIALPGYGSTALSQQAQDGKWSVLLRVRGYNGEPNDAEVELDWYVTGAFNQGGADGGLSAPPAWDGSDAWPVNTDSLVALDGGGYDIDTPKFVDPAAYISAGVLVAGIPDVFFTLSGTTSSIVVRLRGGFVVAHVEKEPSTGKRTLKDGLIVARWTLTDVFAAVSSYRDENGNTICTDSALWATGKGVVCQSADLLTDLGQPTKPCDALSFGAAFQAFPALLGTTFPPAQPLPGCPPETDPQYETCP